MRYHLLAVDFDGTLAEHGKVPEGTLQCLRDLRDSGRLLVMVTGRRLAPLLELCPWIQIFSLVVAENGALLYRPETKEQELLATPPPPELVERLRAEGITNLEPGAVVVGTWRPHENICLEVISELGLDLQIVFNKDAVMLLPSGCNKASGLQAALLELGIAPLNIVAVGDAENDEAMLRFAGISAAVDNAIEPVKKICDIVTSAPRGDGVAEVCKQILKDDLIHFRTSPNRCIPLGQKLDDTPFLIAPYGESVLVTGKPAGGKSRFATRFLEQLHHARAQCCIIDPEGDYQDVQNSITIGTVDRPPAAEEVIQVLSRPDTHTVVSFFAVEKDQRPQRFNQIFRALSEFRSRTGRPHWILIDEAHYMAPKGWRPADQWSKADLDSTMFVTAYQDRLSLPVLQSMDWIVSIAENPRDSLRQCVDLLGEQEPTVPLLNGGPEEHVLLWRRGTSEAGWIRRMEPESVGRRHRHNLLNGKLEKQYQFIFRGSEGQFNLRAKNLQDFIDLAEGLDDKTWHFHLSRGDYSRWFEKVIKDSELAHTTVDVEKSRDLAPQESRRRIVEKIQERFGAPEEE